ncbi:hypothetical protein C8F04DRAFT_1182359 [Mycena alexandri]|uniref:Uncharacterized protein n=1 Tax=Mycena alexandri TaxID=1745969 RepID=A0AAD6X7Y4_9AGAR|nr:hypothetical protein C8F04DRAFT_1182359 [Mycena alexandri]
MDLLGRARDRWSGWEDRKVVARNCQHSVTSGRLERTVSGHIERDSTSVVPRRCCVNKRAGARHCASVRVTAASMRAGAASMRARCRVNAQEGPYITCTKWLNENTVAVFLTRQYRAPHILFSRPYLTGN